MTFSFLTWATKGAVMPFTEKGNPGVCGKYRDSSIRMGSLVRHEFL